MELNIQSTLELNNGVEMPRFGLGTAGMRDPQVARHAVAFALKNGYRMLDTSKNYENEDYVGEGLRQSGLSEKDVFVVTKLEREDYGFEEAKAGYEGSLGRLAIKQVDLYLIHAPEFGPRERQNTWLALVDLMHLARIRAVGVSNYDIGHLEELAALAKDLPAVNQIRLEPFNYAKKKPVVDYCTAHGIRLMAYSPLGVGQLVSDARVMALARRYGKTPAQVLLRWSLQHDFIVIPKASQEAHIVENAQVFDFSLSEDEMEQMDHWGS